MSVFAPPMPALIQQQSMAGILWLAAPGRLWNPEPRQQPTLAYQEHT